MDGLITECIRLVENTAEFTEGVRRFRKSKGRSGPPITSAGLPSRSCLVPGLKLADFRSIALMSNITVDRVGLSASMVALGHCL